MYFDQVKKKVFQEKILAADSQDRNLVSLAFADLADRNSFYCFCLSFCVV